MSDGHDCPYCFESCDKQHSWNVLDFFCGPGGVGHSLLRIGHKDKIRIGLEGIDNEYYGDTYPGAFNQHDVTDVIGLFEMYLDKDIDLIWFSPPCQAYSRLSKTRHENPKEVHGTIAQYGVRTILHYLEPKEYIIENVSRCDDLDDPARINGFGVGEQYGLERWFETSFDCPDAIGSGESMLDMSSGIGRSYVEVAEAKGFPKEWGKAEIRSAIPEAYVRYLLYHCPSTPGVTPPETGGDGVQSSLAEVAP